MRTPHPATLISSVALFVALSGGAYAATQLPRNSVGSAQVRDGSLQPRDFKPQDQTTPLWPQAERGKRGPRGQQGPQGIAGQPGQRGATGPQGDPGNSGVSAYEIVQSHVDVGQTFSTAATCPVGKRALSGGYAWQGDGDPVIVRSAPVVGPNGGASQWSITGRRDTTGPGTITVYATCAVVTLG